MENLFIGYAVDRKLAMELPAVSAAGNNFQLGFIEAWKKRLPLSTASVVPMASWPGSRLIRVSERKFHPIPNSAFRILPYINIKILKEISTMISVYKEVRRFCRTGKSKEINIISYNGNGPISLPILWLKKKYRFTYICLVVDPPLYQGTTSRKGFFWSILYDSLASSFVKAAKRCDVCVVLNAYYAENYLQRKDYYVLDCGVSPLRIQTGERENIRFWEEDGRFHLVFTGILHEHSGILRFIEMFQKIKWPEMVLHIFGRGIFEEQIKAIAQNDSSVVFHGFLKNDLVPVLQSQADMLVCPNTIGHPINKVAFPSKIQEYMLSGTPVLATAVNGLGREYYEHLYLYDDTLENLKQAFDEIRSDGTDGRKKKAEKAKEFILKEKTWDTQIAKLLEYLEKRNEMEKDKC